MIARLLRLGFVILSMLSLLGVAGCSGGAQPGAVSTLTVSDAWVRLTAGLAEPAAGYLTIVNHGTADDALVSASSPQAALVAVHQSSMDSAGMMGMAPVARLDCPIGGTVAFAPGGYHLMISGLTVQLKAGDRLELDLVFEHAGTIVVQADVRKT